MGNVPACIETLEDRRLYSISFLRHVLWVRGYGAEPNTITVGLTPDGQSVAAHLSYPWKKSTRTYELTVPLSKGINLIHIDAGRAADFIKIDQTYGAFSIGTQIMTHDGNDTVTTGDEPDWIQLGRGADSINSGNGNDTILSGPGRETIVVGNGNNQVHAGHGHDIISAGNGDNTFIDPYGLTMIMAGSGHDTYILKNIALDITDYDPSKDTIKKYHPPSNNDDSGLTSQILNAVLDYLI